MFPPWQAFSITPPDDKFWSSRAVQPHEDNKWQCFHSLLKSAATGIRKNVGTASQYAALKPHATKHQVLWCSVRRNHGQWASSTCRLRARSIRGVSVSDQFRAQIEAPNFAYYLKMKAIFPMQDTASFSKPVPTLEILFALATRNGKRYATQNLYLGENSSRKFHRANWR